MASETPYLRAILPSLPSDLAKKVRTLCSLTSEYSAEYILDTLIRLISGAECAPNSTGDTRAQWPERQEAVSKILDSMINRPSPTTKRPRENDSDIQSQTSKRQKSSMAEDLITQGDEPLFTLHSISVTSPIRKKSDITIHEASLRFTNPTTHAVESSIALSGLTRAFLLPTRGKTKAHWTVVLLSSDTPDRGKPTANAQSNQQVIFGIDATALSPLLTTVYTSSTAKSDTLPKGSATIPILLDFLSRLGIGIIQPKPDLFKSACAGVTSGVSASEDGIPGIEAYRGAKSGSLWFAKEGILWGESKPCEFWAVEDLIGKSEGVRIVGVSGRTCSVVLTRKSGEEIGDGEEDVGIEAEFGLVDARERPGIDAWVRKHRHLFGKKKKVGEAVAVSQVEDDSDAEDEDFEMDSDAGSTSSSSTSSEEEDGDDDGSEKGDEESEADESGGSEVSGEQELNEENHPLLRPGAMPRMSRAMVDVVVGMVEGDMRKSPGTVPELQTDEDMEEDELDD